MNCRVFHRTLWQFEEGNAIPGGEISALFSNQDSTMTDLCKRFLEDLRLQGSAIAPTKRTCELLYSSRSGRVALPICSPKRISANTFSTSAWKSELLLEP